VGGNVLPNINCGELVIETTRPASAIRIKTPAARYRDFIKFCLILLRAKEIPPIESRYRIKPDIIGAATFIQGYPAREGFGITLMRNQMVEMIPIRNNNNFGGI
jgi:hypothetical protein